MNPQTKKQTVFITGGAGFIGRELTRKLLGSGYRVIAFDVASQFQRGATFFEEAARLGEFESVAGTILDRSHLQVKMRGADIVIHLAAMLGVRRTEENKLRCMEINVTGTDNVISAAILNTAKHLVFASSSEVYGEPTRNPIKEADETKGKTVYAVSKLAGEELLKGYHQLYPQLAYTIVRLFNTYGEGQVAQFVLARFVKAVMEGRNPVVYGNGQQKRSYGHVDDVTNGFKLLIENPISHGKVYNLGNSTQLKSLAELAQRVIDLLAPDKGLKVDILGSFNGADRSSEREIYMRYCDTTLAHAELGYAPKVTIDDGIRRMAATQSWQHEDWPAH